MNIFCKNFQIPSFYFKEQSLKIKFKIKICKVFFLLPKMGKKFLIKQTVKYFLDFLLIFAFKNKGTNFASVKTFTNLKYFLLPISGQQSKFSEALCQVIKQHFKEKCWIWCPSTIWHNLPSAQFFLSKIAPP